MDILHHFMEGKGSVGVSPCLSLYSPFKILYEESSCSSTLLPLFLVLNWRISPSDPAGFSRYLERKTPNTLLFLWMLWEPHCFQQAAQALLGLVQLRFHDVLYGGSGPATPSLNCKNSGLTRANRHSAEVGFRQRSAAPITTAPVGLGSKRKTARGR